MNNVNLTKPIVSEFKTFNLFKKAREKYYKKAIQAERALFLKDVEFFKAMDQKELKERLLKEIDGRIEKIESDLDICADAFKPYLRDDLIALKRDRQDVFWGIDIAKFAVYHLEK